MLLHYEGNERVYVITMGERLCIITMGGQGVCVCYYTGMGNRVLLMGPSFNKNILYEGK